VILYLNPDGLRPCRLHCENQCNSIL